MVERALSFTIRAHDGQYRKHEKDTPYVFHPIIVSLVLKTAGFNDKVVAAGLLHDVVEDTKYSIDDLAKLFGGDVASLVMTCTEFNKSLSWRERKSQQIKAIYNLPVNNKAIICADKIANLEDLRIQLRKNGYIDFSVFSADRNEQEWFFRSVYNALKENNTDERIDILLERYLNAFYDVFYGMNIVDPDYYNNRSRIYDKIKAKGYLEELTKLKDVIQDNKPYVIEFTGSPSVRGSSIRMLEDFFEEENFRVKVADEEEKIGRYTHEFLSNPKSLSLVEKNLLIASAIKEDLMRDIVGNQSIVMANGALFEILSYMKLLANKGVISENDFMVFFAEYAEDLDKIINHVVVCYNNPLNLGDNRSEILNKTDNMVDYSEAISQCEALITGSTVVDMTKINPNDATLMVASSLLPIMRNEYVLRLKTFLEQKKNQH